MGKMLSGFFKQLFNNCKEALAAKDKEIQRLHLEHLTLLGEVEEILYKENMRKINRIIIHCSATPEGRDVKTSTIKKWHVDPKPKGNGWSDIGYHYVIEMDGTVVHGRPIKKAGAHVSGHNADSIGVCYIGGMDKEMKKAKDTRTTEQRIALKSLIRTLTAIYEGATVHGHNEYANKACPSFNVQQEEW